MDHAEACWLQQTTQKRASCNGPRRIVAKRSYPSPNFRGGSRIPFMKAVAIPFALVTVLTFWSPVNSQSWGNAAFLFVMMMLFYLVMTMYCTPFNALMPSSVCGKAPAATICRAAACRLRARL